MSPCNPFAALPVFPVPSIVHGEAAVEKLRAEGGADAIEEATVVDISISFGAKMQTREVVFFTLDSLDSLDLRQSKAGQNGPSFS